MGTGRRNWQHALQLKGPATRPSAPQVLTGTSSAPGLDLAQRFARSPGHPHGFPEDHAALGWLLRSFISLGSNISLTPYPSPLTPSRTRPVCELWAVPPTLLSAVTDSQRQVLYFCCPLAKGQMAQSFGPAPDLESARPAVMVHVENGVHTCPLGRLWSSVWLTLAFPLPSEEDRLTGSLS